MTSSHSLNDARLCRNRRPSTLKSEQAHYRSESRRIIGRKRVKAATHSSYSGQGALHEGDVVHVFSRSARDWVDGEVVELLGGGLLRVEYEVSEFWIAKTLHFQSDHLILPSAAKASFESDPMCCLDDPAGLDVSSPEVAGFEADGILAAYFRGDYRVGMPANPDILQQHGYHEMYDGFTEQYLFHHALSGISAWRFALNFSSPNRTSSECCVAFHYTSQESFGLITNMGNEILSILRSLKDSGDVFFGEGVYASQFEPHQFQSMEAVLCNNYSFKVFLDAELHKQKTSCAAFCLPIIVNIEDCVNVRSAKTPEMKDIGVDRCGNPLRDPDRERGLFKEIQQDKQKKIACILNHGRDVHVLRVHSETRMAHAKERLEDAVRKCLDFHENSFRNDDKECLKMRSYMGGLLSATAKYGDALEEYNEVLRIQLATYGKNHPSVADTRANIGNVYEQQSKSDDALKEYNEALRIQLATYGKNHPSVAGTRGNMGNVYEKQSKFDDALKEYKEALQIQLATYGRNHPSVATTRNNMAIVYRKQSKFDDALKEYNEALRIDLATYGKNHPSVAATRGNMGTVYGRQSKFDEALKEYNEALRIQLATYGKSHPSVADTRNAMAIVYKQQFKFDDALKEYSEALQIQLATYGKNHPSVAATRGNMGNVYRKQSKFDDALKEYNEALQIQLATYGKNHPSVARTRGNMGNVYEQQSKSDDALKEYNEALRIQLATYGKNHPSVAGTRGNMGIVYEKQSKFDDALKEYNEALQIQLATYGKNHPLIATTRVNMGNVYRKQSKFDDALKEYSEALQINLATYGENHPSVAHTRKNMGIVYRKQSEFDDA